MMDFAENSEKTKKLLEIISGEILEVGPDFNAHTNLHESGLDSMATMQLLIKIEQAFGVQLAASKLTKENLSTVENLARLF
ncbi:MAG: acyl carrier protein [Verrucomicrobia bacterium]|nr:acyl carrier protein [Verrucomicrobiota bacterium]